MMYATLPLFLLLTPILAAPQRAPRQPDPLRIPLVAHHTRQNHPELEVRQEWLRSKGRGMRRKYVRHLDEEGQALVQRDREEEYAELRRRERKRANGQIT